MCMCQLCNDQVACIQAGKIKLSHTSHKQSHKPANYGVFKYKFHSDARKRMVTRQDTRLEFSFSLLLLHSTNFYERFNFLSLNL